MGKRALVFCVFLAAFSIAVDCGLAGDGVDAIHAIQGDGQYSPLVGRTVTIEAVVTGDFGGQDKLKGFFVQEEDSDADNKDETSEGIFVYDPRSLAKYENILSGDLIEATGKVSEYNNLTQITLNRVEKVGQEMSQEVTAARITLPFKNEKFLERYESMLVELPQKCIITANDDFSAYGEKTISPDARLSIPTNTAKPGKPASSVQAKNDRSKLILDDGSKQKYPETDPFPRTLRSGDSVQGIVGILSYDFGKYRIEPVSISRISISNPRPERPESVGGRIAVASINVNNYFNGEGKGGGFPTSRGAESKEAFDRQRTKIIEAISDMKADVIGLMEIENDGYGELSAIRDLTNGLNAYRAKQTGTKYSFIDPGLSRLGNDDISVGLIYDSSKIRPVGKAMTRSTEAFRANNRQPLAQTFEEISTGEIFTVVVSHLKSKNQPEDIGQLEAENRDKGDGQGYWNGARTNAANDLVSWLSTDPTQSGDPDYLILGDMNSYNYEDPITAFKNAGYEDLMQAYVGPDSYTYGFDGQWGELDHALANINMAQQISGATIWHINADESSAFGYAGKWSSSDRYRCSDHDPLIVGLNLNRRQNP